MRTFTRIVGMPGIVNLGVVKEEQIYRSGHVDRLEPLTALGVKSILSFEEFGSFVPPPESGIKIIPLRISVLSILDDGDFDFMVTTIGNPDNWPLLFHCRQGHDRTGVACAAYRVKVDGWSYEEAEEEMIAYGFSPLWQTLKGQLKRYLER